MADKTKIEWTDATWNPITGCSVVSTGCTNCYAMKLAGTRLRDHPSRSGLTTMTKAGPVWNGKVRFNPDWLDQPLRWKKPRMIFVCAHGDLFAEGVPDEWINQVFAVMALAPQHTFQVLTKRPERMREYCSALGRHHSTDRVSLAAKELRPDGPGSWYELGVGGFHLPNVWLGVSVEDQSRADERIPILLDTPAAVRWISAEPLLGPVDLNLATRRKLRHFSYLNLNLHWVVAGGESGEGARPMHPDWARSLRDQCAAAGVPFLFKQWGEWQPAPPTENDTYEKFRKRGARDLFVWKDGSGSEQVGKKRAGRTLDGRTHHEYPEAKP